MATHISCGLVTHPCITFRANNARKVLSAFLAYFPYFKKLKVGLWDYLAVCMSVCLHVYPYQLLNAWTNIYETWYVYHGTWANLNGVIHKSLPIVILWLQHLEFLRQNLNIAWMPVVIFMKLGLWIMPPEAFSTVYSTNHSHQQYQHCSLPNSIALLTSLPILTTVFFLLFVSDTQIMVKGKQAISSFQNFLFHFQLFLLLN
jgi:hypothetical protein